MVYASARDRTKEFQELAEFFKRRNPTGSQKDDEPSTSQPDRASPQKLSDFNRRAAGIGQQISDCSGRLRTLAKLAKQASTFDDPTQKINELTLVIKQDLQQLNQSISELQQLATRDAGSTGRQGSNHSVSVVNNLRNRLKGTTDDFKKVLEERKDSLKRQSERRQQYSALSETSMPLLPTSGPSFLDSSYETQGDGASSSQAQQQQMVAQTDQYLSSRAEALTQVESAISELAGMFNQLAVMVQEQGELAIRIDENVDETLANVDSAQGQLLKYLQTISGNRMLIIKVFAVIVVFLVLFIMVS